MSRSAQQTDSLQDAVYGDEDVEWVAVPKNYGSTTRLHLLASTVDTDELSNGDRVPTACMEKGTAKENHLKAKPKTVYPRGYHKICEKCVKEMRDQQADYTEPELEKTMSHADPVDPERPVAKMRVKDARVKIGRQVGVRQSQSSELNKRVLNSMHAALTGEWYYDREHYRTPLSPPLEELREQVAIELANRDYELFGEILDEGRFPTRPFRRQELLTIVNALKLADDKRPFMQS